MVVVVLVGVLVTLIDFSIPHKLNKLLLLVLSFVLEPLVGETTAAVGVVVVVVVVGWFKSSRLAELEANLRNLSRDFRSTMCPDVVVIGDAVVGVAFGDVPPAAAVAAGPLLRLRVAVCDMARGLRSTVFDLGKLLVCSCCCGKIEVVVVDRIGGWVVISLIKINQY